MQFLLKILSGRICLLIRYLKYIIIARHYSGHGLHSPFVYEFASSILFIRERNKNYKTIYDYRSQLLQNRSIFEPDDLGAGSSIVGSKIRRIDKIAETSSTRLKFGKVLARIVAFYKPVNIIEIGTSLGIGTSFLALNMLKSSSLFTIEGDKSLHKLAKDNLSKYFDNNVKAIEGNFNVVLPGLLKKIDSLDLVFFDGNHRKEPTIFYFELCLTKVSNNGIFIFDDIHWSLEMEEAWKYIKSHPRTKVSIDLFQFGLVFFKKELSCEHYIIRY
jgi:predicted O-methyltransferase YrrM